MTIRRATQDDREILVMLAVHFCQQVLPYTQLHATPASLGRLVDLLFGLEERAAIYVVELDGEIVGGLAICENVNLVTGETYADEICWWVEPTRRMLRAGPLLIAAAEDWATSRGLTYIKMVAPIPSRVGKYLASRGYIAVEQAHIKVL